MPRNNGTQTRRKVMLVTDSGEMAINGALSSFIKVLEGNFKVVQTHEAKTQLEIRFVNDAAHARKAALTPEQKRENALRTLRGSAERLAGRKLTDEEFAKYVGSLPA